MYAEMMFVVLIQDEYEIVVAPDPAYSSLAKVLGPEESKRYRLSIFLLNMNKSLCYCM